MVIHMHAKRMSKPRIGCHVSIGSGMRGIGNAIESVRASGANFMQVFVSNPRSGKHSPNSVFDTSAEEIRALLQKNGIGLVIHAPYVLNFAKPPVLAPSSELSWWVKTLLQELEVCHNVGGIGVVVHVGKHLTLSPAQALANMHHAFQYVLQHIRLASFTSKLILETAAGQGTELLTDLRDFLAFYDRFGPEDQRHFKLCLDTCHVFAAGASMDEALALLKVHHAKFALVHLNDSKGGCGSCVDRHDNVGQGKIGAKDLKRVVDLATGHGIPVVLETPDDRLWEDVCWLTGAAGGRTRI